jgi:hypothetical protein
MTIRPADTAFIMACDDCGHERAVTTLADIDWTVERIGWARIVTTRADLHGPVVGHLCPRCAATNRRTAA